MNKKILIKKGLVVAVIILFFSVSVIPLSGTTDVKRNTIPTAKGDTLYVGGNGTGNYTNIQDAIDDASDGDMIIVYNGSYYERLIVDKILHIKGIPSPAGEKPIIDASGAGNAIKIDADNCIIEGFFVHNFGDGSFKQSAFKILEGSIYTIIRFNEIKGDGFTGIYLEKYAHYTEIYNNSINDTTLGITMYCGSTINQVQIYNNYITDVFDAIAFNFYDGRIHNNTIIGSSNRGIFSGGETNNVIRDNLIINNNRGIEMVATKNNIILHNTINYNRIGIYMQGGDGNIITNNTISYNEIGIRTSESNLKIINNNITYNTLRGFNIRGAKNLNITQNNIIENRPKFIYFRLTSRSRVKEIIFYENYWTEPKQSPKLILGVWEFDIFSFYFMGELVVICILIPAYVLDKNPAQEPYDIEV